ncbi:MAG: restriction endonuclease subunit S [Lentisphaeria bacterium]|nr:restriction endonuclease subunit S [Lentisphaeria bacterium]
MNTWPTTKIGDICTRIAMGPFGSNIRTENFVQKGVPVLNGSNLVGYILKEDNFNYVTEQKAEELKNSVAYRGDIVVTHRGTLGQIVYIPSESKYDKYVISQSQFLLRVNPEKADCRFVTYFFHSAYGQYLLLSNASQVGVPALARPTSTFKTLEIPLPPLKIQKQIADFMCLLDAKIQLNTKINRNLEQQARAIFKSWFVDLEPFQDGKFVDSELGPIPEGWALGTLKDMLEIRYGKDHKKLSNGTIPVYGSGGIMRFADTALYSGESVLIPRKGTLNNVLRVTGDFWTVDTMFYSIPKRKGAVKFSFHILSNMDLASMNSGSAVPSMTTDILNSINIIIPPQNILDTFEATTDALWRLYESNSQESNRLATLRDTLLPKLMSGEIDVSEVKV